ncbi:MAG: hypothetical protein GXY34_09735 [Syntrophomonadaceae bacterium]|nr:hypothetical protein [Syntrophomonadaceae bacterium]
MQKPLAYLLIFIFLTLAGSIGADYTMARHVAERSPYYLCFASIGAISLESRLDCWAKLKANLNDDEMNIKLTEILKPLNLSPADGRTNLKHQGSIHKLHYTCHKRGLDYQVVINCDAKINGTDIIVTVKTHDPRANLQQIAARLKSAGRMDWKAYFFYSGKMPEQLDQAAQNNLMKVVLKLFKAQQINHYQDEHMTIVTAYSRVLDCDSITLNGRDCNLQASVRNDTVTDMTYIYLGSPLLLGDY